MQDERKGLPSASIMERIAGCPGCLALCAGLKTESTAYSEAGDRIHSAFETGEQEGLDMPEADLLAAVKRDEERLLRQWMEDFKIAPETVTIEREERHWISDINTGKPVCSGKLDFAAVAKNQALVLDLKSGRKKVTVPVRNLQLRTNAVALYCEKLSVMNVRVGIIQPFVKAEPPHDYGFLELSECHEHILRLLAAAKSPDAPRCIGPYCDYCPGKLDCPEHREQLPALTTSNPIKRWAALTPDEKLALFNSCALVTKLVKEIKDRIKAELVINPNAIPGLRKTNDQKPREIKSVVGFYEHLLQSIPDTAREQAGVLFRDAVSLSVGDAEKIYRKLTGATEAEAAAWIEPIVKRGFKQGSVEKV